MLYEVITIGKHCPGNCFKPMTEGNSGFSILPCMHRKTSCEPLHCILDCYQRGHQFPEIKCILV